MFRQHLATAARNCRDRTTAADYAGWIIVVQRQFRDYGESMSLLQVASGLATLSARSPGTGISCSEIGAAWVVMSKPR